MNKLSIKHLQKDFTKFKTLAFWKVHNSPFPFLDGHENTHIEFSNMSSNFGWEKKKKLIKFKILEITSPYAYSSCIV
jgi:hypothetical protein